jgi:hypothetical protein
MLENFSIGFTGLDFREIVKVGQKPNLVFFSILIAFQTNRVIIVSLALLKPTKKRKQYETNFRDHCPVTFHINIGNGPNVNPKAAY